MGKEIEKKELKPCPFCGEKECKRDTMSEVIKKEIEMLDNELLRRLLGLGLEHKSIYEIVKEYRVKLLEAVVAAYVDNTRGLRRDGSPEEKQCFMEGYKCAETGFMLAIKEIKGYNNG